MPCLYLLHIHPAYHHARHYLGYSSHREPWHRIAQHLGGWGSPLIDAALDWGCRVLVADVWDGDRGEERRLKRASHVAHWCPLCDSPAKLDRALRTGTLDAERLIALHAPRRGGVVPR